MLTWFLLPPADVPNVSDLGLEDIGLDFDPRGGVKVDQRGATNLPGVWAAGDVTGQAWLAHAASRMAEVVVHNITGQKDIMRHDTMPAVVYTSPEVAVVGLTKEEATERGFKVKTWKNTYGDQCSIHCRESRGRGYV
jgi:dihydrolipoamide dehydrogenase